MFEVVATCGRSRLGLLHSAKAKVQTPACLIASNHGSPEHLLPDLVQQLPATAFLHLHVGDIIKHPGAEALNAFAETRPQPAGYADFANLPATPVLLTPQDACSARHDDTASEILGQYVRTTSTERVRVTAADYAALVKAVKPELFVGLSDFQSVLASANRHRKSVTRTNSLTRTVLDELQAAPELAQRMLVPIVGGLVPVSREISTKMATDLSESAAGFALLGFFTGDSVEERQETLSTVCDSLPSTKVRLLHHATQPVDILDAVAAGVDLIDGSMAVQYARDGLALDLLLPEAGADWPATQPWPRPFTIDLWQTQHEFAMAPLQSQCGCYTCKTFKRSYIHHLLETREILATVALTQHNTTNLMLFMADVRASIQQGTFEARRHKFFEWHSLAPATKTFGRGQLNEKQPAGAVVMTTSD